MIETETHPPGLLHLLRKFSATGLAALKNRGELLSIELQEEKARVIELLIWAAALIFFGFMTIIALTGTIILLFPSDKRVYAAVGFCILYLIGAVVALFSLRSLIKNCPTPFSSTLAEIKKDAACLESSK